MPKKKILVIEDSYVTGKLLSNFFWFYGYETHCITGMEGVISALKLHKYEFVIIDYPLSGINFQELIGIIKGLTPDIPIIGLSGAFNETEMAEMGIEKIISKPIDLRGIREAIGFLLNDSTPHP